MSKSLRALPNGSLIFAWRRGGIRFSRCRYRYARPWSCREARFRVTGERVPPGFVNDDRLGAPPRAHEFVQVLLVVEGVAADPVDEPNIGIAILPPIVIEWLAGPEKHVGETGNGNEVADRVFALRQSGPREGIVNIADAVAAAIAESKSATWKPIWPSIAARVIAIQYGCSP